MMKFRASVYVFAPDVDRIVLRVAASQAAHLLKTGRAIIKEKRGKLVEQLRLTVCNLKAHQLECKAGSYGIHRGHTDHGHMIYEHKRWMAGLAVPCSREI